jgi:hypothetical protein
MAKVEKMNSSNRALDIDNGLWWGTLPALVDRLMPKSKTSSHMRLDEGLYGWIRIREIGNQQSLCLG